MLDTLLMINPLILLGRNMYGAIGMFIISVAGDFDLPAYDETAYERTLSDCPTPIRCIQRSV